MKLHSIHTGNFRLDGGAMFGVVPKVIWQKSNPADENNQIGLAMRSLLIEDGDRLVLIDTGIGNKQDSRFFSYYNLYGPHSLEKSLHKAGFSLEDVTDVFLTHLHFDHVGGALYYPGGEKIPKTTFPRATYWTNKSHWEWAVTPNPREKASFLKENILPLSESGQLAFIDPAQPSPFPRFDILFVDGHTEKQMIPVIKLKDRKLIFAADLIPTVAHIPLPYLASYDVRPLQTMQEKKSFLNEAADQQYFLFFEHDANYEVCTVKRTEKGVRPDMIFSSKEIFL
jgi:glyoxylase-like metal-dependent hydrolase (beta-lactamase superfamily II)